MRVWTRLTTPLRAIIIYILCLRLAGCATPRQVYLSEANPETAGEEAALLLEEGMIVKVTLLDGRQPTGRVGDITEMTFALADHRAVGNTRPHVEVVDFDQVASVELLQASGFEKGTALVVAITMAALVAFGIWFAYGMSGGFS